MRVNYQYLKKQLNTHLDIISCRDEFSIESGSRPKGGIIDIKEGILSLGGEHIDRKKGKINFEPQKLVTREFFDSMTKGKVKNNDILINKDGVWTGKVGLLECEENEMLAVNEHNFILRAISINQKYAFYFFFSELGQKQIIRTIRGSAQPGINSKFLKDIYIPIPPISEQKKIAKILYTVDDAIEKTNAIIEETRQLKKGLMLKLFTEGIGHTRFKETKIGKIPEEWEVGRLDNWLDLITYGFTNPMPTTNSGPYMITAKDIYDGKIKYDNCRMTSIDNYENDLTEKSKPIIGDVLLTKDGTLGRTAVVDSDITCISQSVALLRPKNIHSEFLHRLLSAPYYQNRMLRDAGGSTIKHIYITIVNKMLVAVPSLKEQTKIAQILSEVDAKIEKEEATKAELEQLKKGLMQVLLTGKVRVKA